jgi:16S rRNA (cytosine1402-N4)-methyltransferase
MDVDSDALQAAEKRLMPFGRRKTLVKANYADMRKVLADLKILQVDGILLDLGVSSHQLDAAERGFSLLKDAPLDMRMDSEAGRSAYDVVNTCSERELKDIIRQYGEEIMAGRIARAIAEKRKEAPIKSTTQLAAIVAGALPGGVGTKKFIPQPGPSRPSEFTLITNFRIYIGPFSTVPTVSSRGGGFPSFLFTRWKTAW